MNYIIPIVVIPVLTKRLGGDNYGIIAFAQYFAAILMFACDYGFVYTGPQQVSQNQQNGAFLDRLFSTITSIKLGFLLAGVLITFVFCATVDMTETETEIIFISLLSVAGSVLTPLWFLQGAQRIRSLTIISIFFKSLQLVLLVVCIQNKADVFLAALIFFGANFGLGLCSFIYTIVEFKVKFIFPSVSQMKDELKKGFNMFLSVFFSSIYIQGTGLLLGLITGSNSIVGLYSAAEKIVRAVTALFNPFVQAFFPFISKMFVMNRQMGNMLFFKFLNLVFIVTVFAALMVFLCSGLIVHVMFEKEFEPSIWLICIMCPVIVFGNAANLLGNNLYMQLGWERVTVWVMFGMACFNTVMCVMLIPLQNATGAALSLVSTEVLAALVFFGYYRYKSRF